MFYEVRVLDEKGDLKKVISSKKLSRDFWRRNTQPQDFPGKPGFEDSDSEQEWKPELASGKVNFLKEVCD